MKKYDRKLKQHQKKNQLFSYEEHLTTAEQAKTRTKPLDQSIARQIRHKTLTVLTHNRFMIPLIEDNPSINIY